MMACVILTVDFLLHWKWMFLADVISAKHVSFHLISLFDLSLIDSFSLESHNKVQATQFRFFFPLMWGRSELQHERAREEKKRMS